MKYQVTHYINTGKVGPGMINQVVRNFNADNLIDAMTMRERLEASSKTRRVTVSVMLYDSGDEHDK